MLAEQPYFARVNNRTVVAPGEVAYLPCRVKSSQEGYMVSVQIYLHIYKRATWSVSTGWTKKKCDLKPA